MCRLFLSTQKSISSEKVSPTVVFPRNTWVFSLPSKLEKITRAKGVVSLKPSFRTQSQNAHKMSFLSLSLVFLIFWPTDVLAYLQCFGRRHQSRIPMLFSGASLDLESSSESQIFVPSLRVDISEAAEQVVDILDRDDVDSAISFLMEAEKDSSTFDSDEDCYHVVIRALTRSNRPDSHLLAENLFEYGVQHDVQFGSKAYNSIILSWSESHKREGAQKCVKYLYGLWELYDERQEDQYVPMRSSYISTIAALSRSRYGRRAAEKAEELLEEMETYRVQYPHLGPNTLCVNAVL